MGVDWVQKTLREKVGFAPYAGTLNLRLDAPEEVARWKEIREEMKGIDIPPGDPSFCSARCFLARVEGFPDLPQGGRLAVLLPEVDSYPADKMEIIAPFHVKDSLHIADGDRLTLEFLGEA